MTTEHKNEWERYGEKTWEHKEMKQETKKEHESNHEKQMKHDIARWTIHAYGT